MMNRLVLLDRDGTINVEKHYLCDPDALELLPGAAAGIRLLRQVGFSIAVVTNQAGVGRGLFDLDRVDAVHQRLHELLSEEGTAVDCIYVCPHSPDEKCHCRKPAPGLALRAAVDFGASLLHSFVIGDKDCDIEMGRRIGATTILVRTGHGHEYMETSQADHIVTDLLEAARLIEHLVVADSSGVLRGRP
jgi:D-glycero-D-manno-heptose 1,7-bisphosphate phosphatase